MKAENKIWLDTNRHHLDMINKAGTVKGLQIKPLLDVMREEFEPNYPTPDDFLVSEVFKFVRDLYRNYDNYLAKSSTVVRDAPKKRGRPPLVQGSNP